MTLADAVKIRGLLNSPEFIARLAESEFGIAFSDRGAREMTEDEMLRCAYEDTKRQRGQHGSYEIQRSKADRRDNQGR